ncbi:MAG: hypothetical protein ACYTAO_17655 [Planctomycetota bacterium]|jgi:hypothetical protein
MTDEVRPIEEVAAEIAAEVPAEDWDRLPRDLASTKGRRHGGAERIDATVRAILDLLELRPDWGSCALPVTEKNVHDAIWFVTHIVRHDAPAPQVVPTSRGGVQLKWHTDGVDVEIELHADEPTGDSGQLGG